MLQLVSPPSAMQMGVVLLEVDDLELTVGGIVCARTQLDGCMTVSFFLPTSELLSHHNDMI